MIMWDAPDGYVVAFTTRNGGVSKGPYASLNLGLLTADDDDSVQENRRRACAAVGADAARLAMNRQVHGAVVHRAEAGRRGAPGDGLWTDEECVPLLTLTADCLPIAIARADGPARLALLHAGRAGLLEGVVEAGVSAVDGRRVRAAIGPGIGPCCYEVGDDIRDAYRSRFGPDVVRGRNLDLWRAAELALRAAGADEVERLDVCTSCDPDRFFSHRRDDGVTGRQGVIGYLA